MNHSQFRSDRKNPIILCTWSLALKLAPSFWIETIALFAFGASWLVKGEVVLRDKAKHAGSVSK